MDGASPSSGPPDHHGEGTPRALARRGWTARFSGRARLLVVGAVVGVAALAVALIVILGRPSEVEKAVARHLDVSASDVSCEKSPIDALADNFACEVELEDNMTACYSVFVNDETGEIREIDMGTRDPETGEPQIRPGVFKVGATNASNCDEVFEQYF